MSNQKSKKQSNVDGGENDGAGKVDQETPSSGPEAKPWRTPTGQLLPGHPYRFTSELQPPAGTNQGRGNVAKMLAAAMAGSLERRNERVGEVLDMCIDSNDPYKWGLYLKYAGEFLKGQPANDVPSSFEFAKSLMASIEHLKAENAELRRQLDLCAGQTVDANAH